MKSRALHKDIGKDVKAVILLSKILNIIKKGSIVYYQASLNRKGFKYVKKFLLGYVYKTVEAGLTKYQSPDLPYLNF